MTKPATDEEIATLEKDGDYFERALIARIRSEQEARRIDTAAACALASSIREKTISECVELQPSTAENPKESAYQQGRFDGIIEYSKTILDLLEQKP